MGVVAGSARATVVRSVARSGAISTITEAASVVLRRVNVKEVFFALFLYQGCTAMFSNSSADVAAADAAAALAAARIDSGSDASADRLHAEARITGRIIDAGAGAMAPLVVAAPPSPTRKPRRLPELAGVRS